MALDASPRAPVEVSSPEPYPGPRWRQPPRRALNGAWLAMELVRTIRSLLLLGVLLAVVLLAVNFSSASGQLAQRLSGALQRTGQGFATAGQTVADAFNPTHPPRYAISQDTELAALSTMRIGETVGVSRDYDFALAGIRRREDASGNPDVAQYGILQRRYKTPRETKILGVTVRVDRGEQQYVLDRGETFRIGGTLYKVNWISASEQQMAVAVYRNPDQFAGKLAFESD